jgi:iron complex outermembrane receptor protein/vitamin B12 transporter
MLGRVENRGSHRNLSIGVWPSDRRFSDGICGPQSQVETSVSVIDSDQIEALNKLDVLENLDSWRRASCSDEPAGAHVSLFIRGGESDFNKVLVDGIPVNDINGSFDFAQLSIAGRQFGSASR